MALSPARWESLTLLTILALLPLLTHAQGETGSNRINSNQCPPNVEASMVYSPFKAYFHWPIFSNNHQQCWTAADCLFEAAGESRKQQFAAIALVMGLIPLTLKDIAWPERRVIHVTKRLNWVVEVLVLALGLVPLETSSRESTRGLSGDGNMIAKAAWKLRRATVCLWIVACALLLIGSYAGLAIMEIYSKRSALGCTFPVFVAAWYVVALVPAGIHSFFAAMRRMRYSKHKRQHDGEGAQEAGLSGSEQGDTAKDSAYSSTQYEVRAENSERKQKIVSAVQGADEDWPVQLAWGIYYIAGTLIFTSIMAVTVVELVCWVGLGFAVTGSSKLLAFFLCLAFEKTGAE